MHSEPLLGHFLTFFYKKFVLNFAKLMFISKVMQMHTIYNRHVPLRFV